MTSEMIDQEWACPVMTPGSTSMDVLVLNYAQHKSCTLSNLTRVENLVLTCNDEFPTFMTGITSVGNLTIVGRRDCGLWKLSMVDDEATLDVNEKALSPLDTIDTVYGALRIKFVSKDTKLCMNIRTPELVSSRCTSNQPPRICCEHSTQPVLTRDQIAGVVFGAIAGMILLSYIYCWCSSCWGNIKAKAERAKEEAERAKEEAERKKADARLAMVNNTKPLQCGVCKKDAHVSITFKCGHQFHEDCIRSMFESTGRSKCPACSNYSPPPSYADSTMLH
jgi:hypothetical protein